MAQASDAVELDTLDNTREFEQIEEDFQEVRGRCMRNLSHRDPRPAQLSHCYG